MKNFITFVLACMLIVEGVGKTYHFPDDIGKYNTKKRYAGHPMLFFDRHDIPHYLRMASTTHREHAKRLQQCAEYLMSKNALPPVTYDEFASAWNEKYGNFLPALSMTHILQPSDQNLLRFITLYMDRMASYWSWYVRGSETDEVPVAHSLMGFVTAFDMIYDTLDYQRRQLYLKKVKNVTKLLYDLSFKRWWGTSYIQNHVATNLVALFASSLVLQTHEPEAEVWLKHSLNMLDRNLHLLNGVTDGSVSEGVVYGSYTSRSVSMFFLSL